MNRSYRASFLARRVRTVLMVIVALATAAAPAAADQTDSRYTRERRTGYIARALAALRAIDSDQLATLQRRYYLGGRRQCRAAFGAPTVGCLIDLARAICDQEPEPRRSPCRLILDIVVTNQLSESEFVDTETRVALVNAGGDFRAAMQTALNAEYAELAAELALAWLPDGDLATGDRAAGNRAGGDLAGDIDRFCGARSRAQALAWQRCVAAIVWYIAASERESETS